MYLIWPLIGLLAFIIILLGQVVCKAEKWGRFDALYWSLITATTVGYGDIRPIKKTSKILSILIACTGLMLAGIIVSITLTSTNMAFEKNIKPQHIETMNKDTEKPCTKPF